MEWFFELREAGVPVNVRAMGLKACVLWHKFIMEQGTDTAMFRTPDRETVATWVTDAHTTITANIMNNSWIKTMISFFENE